MNRHNFFNSGLKEILHQFMLSPVGEIVSRQLQSFANLLAPKDLNTYRKEAIALITDAKNVPAVFRRPPGSLAQEEEFNLACTRCGDCIEACPHLAIHGDEDTGPFIDPNKAACHLCSDFPCIASCQEGALQEFDEFVLPSFGVAELIVKNCNNTKQALSCDACYKICPVSDAILVANDASGIPEFTKNCTACGLCRMVCPTIPVAIEIACEK